MRRVRPREEKGLAQVTRELGSRKVMSTKGS